MATRGWESVSAIAARSKFGNCPTTVRGLRFDSQREADYWIGLEARQRNGEISNLRRQVVFPLLTPVLNAAGEIIDSEFVGSYIADMVYDERGTRHIVDVKGFRTPLYKWKARHFAKQYRTRIEEV